MHVNVNGGHTPTAPGASHYIDELTEDRAVKEAVKAELSRRGHTVSDSTSPDWCNQNQDLAYQATMVNSSGCDLAISIHFNASSVTGGTRGVEAYYYGGDDTGHHVAARMSANVAALLGLPDRGAKDGSHLYFTRMTNPTAVLIEVCFVDAEGDADAYNPTPYAEIARAIADGIEGNDYEEDDMTPDQAKMLEELHGTLCRTDNQGWDTNDGHDIYGRINHIEQETKRLADMPQSVWGYTNENVETADAYQILRDIRDEISGLRAAVEAKG